MTKLRGVLLLVLVLVLGGAGYFAWRYKHRVQPEPPPRGASLPGAPPTASQSSVSVPIAVDAALIEGIANDKLPHDLLARPGIAAGEGVTAGVVVRRGGRITAGAEAGKLHLRVPIEADIEADWQPAGLVGLMSRGKRQHIKTRATFVVRAEIDLGVDAQWNLATSTEATLRWEDDPVVPVGPLNVKLSALVGDRIDEQFAGVTRTLDEQLRRQIPTRPLITQAWAAAFRTLRVGPRGDLWLVLRPTAMYLGEVRAHDGQVSLDAAIHGVFRVVVGAEPPAAEPTPLPARSAPPGEPGVALDVPVSLTFAAANQQLDERLEGQVFDVPLDVVGQSVALTIGAVEVYPSGEHVAVAVEFSADLPGAWLDMHGLVYLVGTPTLDPGRNQLSITDLAYDSRTNVALVDVAEWMLHDAIVRRVRERLVFDFTGQLDGYRDQINAAIADYRISELIRLRGKIDEVRVVAVTVTDPAIVAGVQLRGSAKLDVAPSP
ncbi:MAG TPA: DUF4403 family protein [Nannocystis sp.]